MLNRWATFYVDESGATAIEYGLLVAGIGLAVAAAGQQVGVDFAAIFTKISDALK
ncbi:MAG: Flp family type IVb pilin [Hyphomicrobiales bacterium]|nr:Flp family type IVb pilin [Hyphomicrobiales bacterium]